MKWHQGVIYFDSTNRIYLRNTSCRSRSALHHSFHAYVLERFVELPLKYCMRVSLKYLNQFFQTLSDLFLAYYLSLIMFSRLTNGQGVIYVFWFIELNLHQKYFITLLFFLAWNKIRVLYTRRVAIHQIEIFSEILPVDLDSLFITDPMHMSLTG